MFEYFDQNYPWNMAVMMAAQSGGEMSEIDEACRPLRDLPSPANKQDLERAQEHWWDAWHGLTLRIRGLAEADRAAGRGFSAGRKMMRACFYAIMAERFLSHRDPRKRETYLLSLNLFAAAVALRGDPVEIVEIPYEGTTLPALLVRAEGSGPTPCMIQFDGFDVGKEQSYLCSLTEGLRQRGISSLIVDHPGVGGAIRLRGLSAVRESERPASACLDWLASRPEVDSKRIGIVAPSLGGYYAPRAAAFEPRLACCVAWGARWDNDGSHGRILRDPGRARSIADWVDHAMWYYGTQTVEETAAAIAAMNLDNGVAERIRCPILVAVGGNDRQVPLEQAELTVQRAANSPRRNLRIFTDAEGGVEHCGVDNFSIQTDFMADWCAEILGGRLGPDQANSTESSHPTN